MKCPKCGYLGFEATDRCRHCGYNFSLVPSGPPPDVPLRVDGPEGPVAELPLYAPEPSLPPEGLATDDAAMTTGPVGAVDVEAPVVTAARGGGDELPLFAPRPAGPPLAVRRSTGEVGRARRTTRTVRPEPPPLPLLVEPPEPELPSRDEAPAQRRPQPQPRGVAALGNRIMAAAIDVALVAGIDVTVLWLTLRIAGLQPTASDLAVLPVVPMAAFLAVLAFLYLVGFTVGGGQTIGKMATGIRVIGDDGRGVDLTGAIVRALACLAMAATAGIAWLPVLFGADRRGLHDRLAGTRVVSA